MLDEVNPNDVIIPGDPTQEVTEAESQHYRSRTEYAIAVKNVHFEKGTLLDYDGVACTEGPWPGKAYHDADRLDRQRGRPWAIPPSAIIVSTDIQPPIVHLPPIDELPAPIGEFELPANPAPVPPNPAPLP